MLKLNGQANKVYRTRAEWVHDHANEEERVTIAFHHVNADPNGIDKLRANDVVRHPYEPGKPERCTLYRFGRAKLTDKWQYLGRDEMDLDEFSKHGDPKEIKR